MKRLRSILVAFLLLPSLALCFESGNDFLRECKPTLKPASDRSKTERWDTFYCLGYVSGFIDGVVIGESENPLFCFPESGIETRQSLRIAIKWLEENSKELHKSPRLLLYKALVDAFPCSSRKR